MLLYSSDHFTHCPFLSPVFLQNVRLNRHIHWEPHISRGPNMVMGLPIRLSPLVLVHFIRRLKPLLCQGTAILPYRAFIELYFDNCWVPVWYGLNEFDRVHWKATKSRDKAYHQVWLSSWLVPSSAVKYGWPNFNISKEKKIFFPFCDWSYSEELKGPFYTLWVNYGLEDTENKTAMRPISSVPIFLYNGAFCEIVFHLTSKPLVLFLIIKMTERKRSII